MMKSYINYKCLTGARSYVLLALPHALQLSQAQTQTQAQTQAPENDIGNIGNFLCGKFCTGVKLIWDRFSSFDFDAHTQGRRQA